MDRRLTAANGRVADAALRGTVEAGRFVEGVLREVDQPVADLLAAPGGRRERQVVLGAGVKVYEARDGWAFVQAVADGYVGYLPEASLRGPVAATHRVTARTTHLYPEADFKAHELASLSFGSRVRVLDEGARFVETDRGFVPKAHVAPLEALERDPVAVAERFLGTPYLWGGNSGFGIDCSGLMQAACLACGIPCPGDSAAQERSAGQPVDDAEPLARNDAIFWKGHVAIAVSSSRLIHANAHHMAVTYEPVEEALRRIAAQGHGTVTGRRRLVAAR